MSETTAQPTLLVVEDNRDFRRLLVHWLTRQGYGVLESSTLAESLRLLGEHPEIAAIVLDLRLPDTRDTEAIHRLSLAAPLVPIGVLTGRDDLAAVDIIHLGAKMFLHKNHATPESIQILAQTLLNGAPETPPLSPIEPLPAHGIVRHYSEDDGHTAHCGATDRSPLLWTDQAYDVMCAACLARMGPILGRDNQADRPT